MPAGVDRERTLAYMLRLWHVTDGELSMWLASLQDVRTGEQLDFPDLDGAYRYLRARIALASGGSPAREAPEDEAPHGRTGSG
jgi:hypothetical protein